MGQDCNFTRSGFKDARTVPRDGVAIPSDAIGTYKRRFQNENPIRTLPDLATRAIETPLSSLMGTMWRTIDQSTDGKLCDAKESWELLEDLALYDNESWNDLRDFAKPVKAISLPQDAPSTSSHRLIKFKNQVQRLMEAHLALNPPDQVNKIGFFMYDLEWPHDSQYCLENPCTLLLNTHPAPYKWNVGGSSAYAIAVEVFDPLPSLCIWEALGGNIRNLDSIWKETGQDCNFIRCGFKDARTVPEDGVAIPSDAVKT
ncbi:hypothetical protein Tco_0906422 [Tanacetum coccineum]|uniref:Uncharacterized protein n=1 Tax=Tanacetum coccineum TaxID=301880 RepID=A0ABQ5CJ57_9ASTR